MRTNQSTILWSLLLILAAACTSGTAQDQEGGIPQNQVGGIPKESLLILELNPTSRKQEQLLSGRIKPKNQTALIAEVQGTILNTFPIPKEGKVYRKGQPIISIDSKEFSLNLKAEKSSFLNSITAILPDLKADYPDNYESWLNYLQQVDIDKPLPELPSPKSDSEKFFTVSRGIPTNFYLLKAKEERLKKHTIYAPFDGAVANSQIDEGGLVLPGTPLLTLISNKSFELETGIGASASFDLINGDEIEFSSNDIEGNWKGTLIRKGTVIDPSTQNLSTFFQIDGENLFPGMYLEGNFTYGGHSDVYVIPSHSVKRDETVLTLQNDIISSQKIEIIDAFQDSLIVAGLEPSTSLILNKFSDPVVGQRVIR